MSSASARIVPPMPRDQRLDMFRGLALGMIFINHAPGTLYENWTSRNFGFSDAAEAFVLMSGLAAGLAYSPQFRRAPFWAGLARVWARARTLYFVHIATTALALGIFAAAALWWGITGPLATNGVPVLFQQPLGAMIGLPLLTYQLGYFNILPLYLVLLLVTPLLLLLAHRHPWPVVIGSIVLWAAAGQWQLNLPNYPAPGGWFFDPFSWQLVFVVGLVSGTAMREGRALVPYDRALFWGSVAFLVFVLLWVRIDALGAFGRDQLLAPLAHIGFPAYFTWFDKTYLPLPRLLHALALAYVLSSIPQLRSVADSVYARPLTLMGRHGLPVFATGSVLDMVIQVVKAAKGQDPVNDGVLFAAGLFALWLLAYVLDRLKPAKAPAAPVAVRAAPVIAMPVASAAELAEVR